MNFYFSKDVSGARDTENHDPGYANGESKIQDLRQGDSWLSTLCEVNAAHDNDSTTTSLKNTEVATGTHLKAPIHVSTSRGYSEMSVILRILFKQNSEKGIVVPS